jgi:hypothetical protein
MKEHSMKFTIQLLIENTDCMPLSISITTIDRACDAVEDVGLRLHPKISRFLTLYGSTAVQSDAGGRQEARTGDVMMEPESLVDSS